MPEQLKNPFQVWEELKRRKVIRVSIVYLATAFAILEAADIIFSRLEFPDWSFNLVIYILCAGFVVTLILSWIYDITPEGVEKTKPAKEGFKEVSSSSNAWKIATYVSIAIIVVLVFLHVINIRKSSMDQEPLKKSIAVLPFSNLSNDSSQIYFCDGFMEDIINQLQKIEAFSVRPRNSTQQYRNTE